MPCVYAPGIGSALVSVEEKRAAVRMDCGIEWGQRRGADARGRVGRKMLPSAAPTSTRNMVMIESGNPRCGTERYRWKRAHL
jgi:hypothetical protein